MNNAPVIADIYSLTVKHHFLLLYLRTATDDSAGTSWPTIQATLKIAKTAPREKGALQIEEKLLKRKAIRLPRPGYPADPRDRINRTVVVEVLISEAGNVLAACAISGPRELRDMSVSAARSALFTPTKLDGKPVRVTGLISYNFVMQ
jgi:outer membrane biosynthesis protein TonB